MPKVKLYIKISTKGKFIAINTCIKTRSQINNLIFQLEELEKQEQATFKSSRRKEITKITTVK
jgi:hypothetical protein